MRNALVVKKKILVKNNFTTCRGKVTPIFLKKTIGLVTYSIVKTTTDNTKQRILNQLLHRFFPNGLNLTHKIMFGNGSTQIMSLLFEKKEALHNKENIMVSMY